MDSKIRELQELIARYSAFLQNHDTEFASQEVHAGCRPRMEKMLEKWAAELVQLQAQTAATKTTI